MRLSMLVAMGVVLFGCPSGQRPVPHADGKTDQLPSPDWPGSPEPGTTTGPEGSVGREGTGIGREGSTPDLPNDAPPPVKCGPTNCPGCCTATNQCQPGSASAACGKGGAACTSCTAPAVCAGGACCTPVCQDKICGQSNGCNGTCTGAASGCVLLFDEFNSTTINGTLWASGGNSGSVSVGAGSLNLSATGANAWADVHSTQGIPANTNFEARVNLSPNQFFDHKGIGFADQRIGADCGVPGIENEAAMWRGQDDDRFAEVATAGVRTCEKVSDAYPGGWRTIRIERIGTSRVDLFEDNILLKSFTAGVPAGPIPVRFSIYRYTSGPASTISIQVDWVKVRPR